MNKPLSLALLAGGVLLIILGVSASNSLSSDISRFFTGSPTDKAIWMMVAGVVAAVVGCLGSRADRSRLWRGAGQAKSGS